MPRSHRLRVLRCTATPSCRREACIDACTPLVIRAIRRREEQVQTGCRCVDRGASSPVLDPLERTGEITFGVIAILTFTGSIRDAVRRGANACHPHCRNRLQPGLGHRRRRDVSPVELRGTRTQTVHAASGASGPRAVRRTSCDPRCPSRRRIRSPNDH